MTEKEPLTIDFTQEYIKNEWENFRYQDKLRWSRIQVIAIAEVALVSGAYTTPGNITWIMKLILASFLFAMIFIMALFAEIDGRDADSHMKRAIEMEKAVGLPEYKRPPRPFNLRGTRLMQIGLILLLLFNITIVFDLTSHLWI